MFSLAIPNYTGRLQVPDTAWGHIFAVSVPSPTRTRPGYGIRQVGEGPMLHRLLES